MISIDTMRAGLTRGEFFLEYLPTISLIDGHCIGAEALIRWRRTTGIVPPMEFIPLAENTVTSGLISYWVIETVAAELGDWLRANPNAQISINVPPEIIGRGGMLYAAEKSGLAELFPQIILEITERGIPDLLGIETINLAKTVGLRIALDDLTLAGGANLAILARANFDIIKIDRSLVSQIDANASYPKWLNEITTMLPSSRMVVVTEGVETRYQFLTLREANIHAAQGFYFSHPIPAAAFITYHRETRYSEKN
jgi:sensor c-di-GMP phosphodiesterase-like protein